MSCCVTLFIQIFIETVVFQIDLGDRLLPCFDSPSGIPFSDINLSTMKAHSPKWSPDSSTSEVTTLQLEFRDLSRSTDDTKYEEVKKIGFSFQHFPIL